MELEEAEGQSDQDSYVWTNNRSDEEADEDDEGDGECNYFETTPTESPATGPSPPNPTSITIGDLFRPGDQGVETIITPAEVLVATNDVHCDQNDGSAGEEYVFENEIDLSRLSDDSTGNGEFVPYFDDVDSLEDADCQPDNLLGVPRVAESGEAGNMIKNIQQSTSKQGHI